MTDLDLSALRNAFGCFPTGVTVITTRDADGTLAWLECARHQTVAARDQAILIGRVVDFAAGDGNPLGFLRGA